MNAAEIIEQIKQLPPEERGKVVDFTRQGMPMAKLGEVITAQERTAPGAVSS
jgi:hypothetical protein